MTVVIPGSKTPLEVPTVHWNGTSKEELITQHITALSALRACDDALVMMSPHGRDYYPQADGAIMRAVEQHQERRRKIHEITMELEAIVVEIDRQRDLGRAVVTPGRNIFKRVDDEEASTLFCPCGSQFTWSGVSDDLETWRQTHAPHVQGGKS
jgi:hypothetical protein